MKKDKLSSSILHFPKTFGFHEKVILVQTLEIFPFIFRNHQKKLTVLIDDFLVYLLDKLLNEGITAFIYSNEKKNEKQCYNGD